MTNLLGSGGITLCITGEWSLAIQILNNLNQQFSQSVSRATNSLVGVDAIVMPLLETIIFFYEIKSEFIAP